MGQHMRLMHFTVSYFTQAVTEKRRHKPRSYCRQNHQLLVEYVEETQTRLAAGGIAARIRIDYPKVERMQISHETIYRWIYLDEARTAILTAIYGGSTQGDADRNVTVPGADLSPAASPSTSVRPS